jgi:hypothetical protein
MHKHRLESIEESLREFQGFISEADSSKDIVVTIFIYN